MINRLLDVFASFQKHNVRYVVIGGIAAALHGIPRATFDLDILIEASPENTQSLLDALSEANFATASLITADEMLGHEITVFKDRVRIDVQISTPGLNFESAWQNRITMEYQGQKFYVVSKRDLISSKRAGGGKRIWRTYGYWSWAAARKMPKRRSTGARAAGILYR